MYHAAFVLRYSEFWEEYTTASIRLDPEREAQLRQIAARKGLSMSKVHRQALRAYVYKETRKAGRYSDVIGIVEGDTMLSTRVAEIFAETLARNER